MEKLVGEQGWQEPGKIGKVGRGQEMVKERVRSRSFRQVGSGREKQNIIF